MAYEVPPLPYDYAALEPHIDEATMKVHHDKHHQAYVDKANGALEGTDLRRQADRGGPEGPRLAALRQAGPPCATTAAATTTTRLFWESMSPDGGGEPDGALAEAIDSAFGSFDDFKTKVKETGVGQFGSGWAWLVHDGSGLAVVGSANQDNPISQGPDPAAGRRRVGARLLPQVPEQAPRLHRGVVERRRLGQGRRALRRRRLATASRTPDRNFTRGPAFAPRVMRTLRLALLAGALCLTFAAPASASRDQESIFEDEHQLLEIGPAAANAGLDDIKTPGRRQRALARALEPAGARAARAAPRASRPPTRRPIRRRCGTRTTTSCAAPACAGSA